MRTLAANELDSLEIGEGIYNASAPGTQIRLSEGELSNVQLGRMFKPRSLDTGCSVLATTWVLDCGNLLGTEADGGVEDGSRLRTGR